MLALFAAPTMGVAQSPVQDQYQPQPDADTDPTDDSGADNDTDPADDAGADTDPAGDSDDQAPVAVQKGDSGGNLPFTGGSVPLVALIGLLLLAAGLVGVAATRRRHTPGSH